MFVAGYKHVYLSFKFGHFNMGVYEDGVSLKWTLQELQFLARLHCHHFSALELTGNKSSS